MICQHSLGFNLSLETTQVAHALFFFQVTSLLIETITNDEKILITPHVIRLNCYHSLLTQLKCEKCIFNIPPLSLHLSLSMT